MITNLTEIIDILNLDIENKKFNLLSYKQLFKKYNGNDWKNYIDIQDKNKNYNKVTIYSTDKYELKLITWFPKKISPIHDHPNNGCILKLLEGQLKEYIYSLNLELINKQILNENEVGYIDNKIGLHKIVNLIDCFSYSLHLYSPSNHQMQIYYTNNEN